MRRVFLLKSLSRIPTIIVGKDVYITEYNTELQSVIAVVNVKAVNRTYLERIVFCQCEFKHVL